MSVDVVLPNLGFGMEDGKLIGWLKRPGDTIRKGEAIAEIEGDKANVELAATVDGTLEEVLVSPDTTVPVGSVLARIRTAGEPAAVPVAQTQAQTNDASGQRITPLAERIAREHGVDLTSVSGSGPRGRIVRSDVQAAMQPTNGNGKVLAAPAIRKLARDRGIDLSAIHGSGSEGQITRADVEAYRTPQAVPQVAAPITAAGDSERREITLTPMRQTIARRLAQSAQEAPHFYVTAELDLTNALRSLPREIGINNLLLYLAVQALREVPQLNATYEAGHLYEYDHVNLALAVALDDGGLMSPVLQHAADFSLAGLAARSRDLISRTRAGKLRQEELGGGTFTVSNLGMIKQIDRFTAIINPPQVAILAVGAAKDRPVVVDGGLHIRKTVHITLSADHRIIDGLLAARFIEAFDNHLQAFAG